MLNFIISNKIKFINNYQNCLYTWLIYIYFKSYNDFLFVEKSLKWARQKLIIFTLNTLFIIMFSSFKSQCIIPRLWMNCIPKSTSTAIGTFNVLLIRFIFNEIKLILIFFWIWTILRLIWVPKKLSKKKNHLCRFKQNFINYYSILKIELTYFIKVSVKSNSCYFIHYLLNTILQ